MLSRRHLTRLSEMQTPHFSNHLKLALWGIALVIISALLFPYFGSIVTSKDIRKMEERRASEIFATLKLARSENGDQAVNSFPQVIHDQLVGRDHILFDFTEISNLRTVDSNTVLLRSKDKHVTLLADGKVEIH